MYPVAGLGKKSLSLLEVAESDDIKGEIMDQFLNLKEAGGYELIRAGAQSRSLEVTPIPSKGVHCPVSQRCCSTGKCVHSAYTSRFRYKC